MFNGCLGALDSNGMDDVVDHDYDTLPPSTLDARKATPGKLKKFMTNCYSFLFHRNF